MKEIHESTTLDEIKKAIHVFAENEIDANALVVLVMNYLIDNGLDTLVMKSIMTDKDYIISIKEKTDAEIIRFKDTEESTNSDSKGTRKKKNTFLH